MTNYPNVQNMSKFYVHQQSVDMKEFLYFWITKFVLIYFLSNQYSDLGIAIHTEITELKWLCQYSHEFETYYDKESILVLKLKEQDRGFEEGQKGGTGREGREGKGKERETMILND